MWSSGENLSRWAVLFLVDHSLIQTFDKKCNSTNIGKMCRINNKHAFNEMMIAQRSLPLSNFGVCVRNRGETMNA